MFGVQTFWQYSSTPWLVWRGNPSWLSCAEVLSSSEVPYQNLGVRWHLTESQVVRPSPQLKIFLIPTVWMIKRYDLKWIKYVSPKFILKVFNQFKFQQISDTYFLYLNSCLCVHRQKCQGVWYPKKAQSKEIIQFLWVTCALNLRVKYFKFSVKK